MIFLNDELKENYLLHEQIETAQIPSEFMDRLIIMDFDGVIHLDQKEWVDVDIIQDEPIEGINETIQKLRADGYYIFVQSARCHYNNCMIAIQQFLDKHGIIVDGITSRKLPAKIYIDDRAITFNGNPNDLYEAVCNFKPWNKKE